MLWALFLGLAVGYVAAIPIGPVNALVIDTSLRGRFGRAVAIGLGGAFADMVYSQIAASGVAPFVRSQPTLAEVFYGIGGIVLIVFGIVTARRARVELEEIVVPTRTCTRDLGGAFLTGILVTVANPAAFLSWVMLAGFLSGLDRMGAIVAGFGIFVGTGLWFLGVAWLAQRGRVKLGARSVWITRAVSGLCVAYGLFLVGKASLHVWAATLPH